MKSLKDETPSPAGSPKISQKVTSSPKSSSKDTSVIPPPVLNHRNVTDEKDVLGSPEHKSPRSKTSSPGPTHKNPPVTPDSDSCDENEDDLGASQNRKNEEKEAQNNNIRASYRNMGFDEGDIAPEDLESF